MMFFHPDGTAGASLQQVHVEWQYSSSVSGVLGFKLYNVTNPNPVCQIADPAARQMDCQVTLEDGPTSFTLTAYNNEVESAHSNSVTVTISGTTPPANNPPTISGTPATSVAEGSSYSFTPSANDADSGDTLTFSISNKPSWATFNTASGRLSGTPGNGDVGTTTGIRITVTDGSGASASLAAFNIEVVSEVLRGDVDCNGVVDLTDLHLTEEILSGRTPSSTVCMQADVNGDGLIGFEEHMYILDQISPPHSSAGSEACTVDPDGTWIEAENYTSMGGGNRSWEIRTDLNDGGVSNGAYMHSTTGGTDSSPDGGQTDYSGLVFPNTARYYFWIRAKNPQTGNSTWAGVDGHEIGALTQNSNTWVWDNSVQNGTGSNNVEITAGTHSLTLWPREPDQRTDGILISTNPAAVSDNSQNPSPPAGFKVIDPRQCQ